MEIISYLLIIVTGVAIILTIYGTCLIYDNLAKASVAYGIACALMAVVLFFVIIKENDKEIETNEPIQEEVQSQPEDTYEPLSGCTTHVAAEIYDQYQNEDGTYSNVFGVDYSEVQCFIWISEQPLPDDVPYLLTMDNKGTLNNPLDDEILVVWKDMN